MTSFLDLNDDCLERLFGFCDVASIVSLSRVCKRLNLIISDQQFPKQTTFNCTIRSYACEEKASEILKCIGKYLIELKICQTTEIFMFYRFLGNNIGQRIRRLSITSPHISEISIRAIEPILMNLEELELRIANTDFSDDDIELQSRCPHLRRLHLQWDTSFIQNTAKWNNLESLTLGDNEYITDDIFLEFMQNNPQLKQLKIGAFNCMVKLNDIAQYLVNLEKLILFQNYSNLSVENILTLQRLENLKQLMLRNVQENDFEGILNNLTKLNGLTDVRIQAQFDQCSDDDIFEPNHQSILGIALEMQNLQVFGISFCKLKTEIIVDFIRFCDHLREIHIHDCDVNFTPQMIKNIVNARKAIRNRCDPLNIFVDFIDDTVKEVNKYF